MTAQEVLAALGRRHPMTEGEWLFYRECWRIDAFVIRCWGSGDGYRRIAYEVKVSRGDFRAELRKPEKRAAAMEVSHQFFFATPAGLVRKEEVPDDCGLLYVSDDGRTRIVKNAPVRAPRALKMSEAIYLCRVGEFRSGVLDLRRQLRMQEEVVKSYAEMQQRRLAELERAQERLREHAGHLVTVGSMWRGRWQPRSWVAAVDDVDIYVEKIHGVLVAVRRVDNGEIDSFMRIDRLLMDYVLLDSRALGVLGAA